MSRLLPFTDVRASRGPAPPALCSCIGFQTLTHLPNHPTNVSPTCRHNLAYVHLVEPRVAGNTDLEYTLHSIAPFRSVGWVLAIGRRLLCTPWCNRKNGAAPRNRSGGGEAGASVLGH